MRVEVQQWEYERKFLPVVGQSEEVVETDYVVEETGHQKDCGHLAIIVELAILFIFFSRTKGERILLTLFQLSVENSEIDEHNVEMLVVCRG